MQIHRVTSVQNQLLQATSYDMHEVLEQVRARAKPNYHSGVIQETFQRRRYSRCLKIT
jgi:hypothetical protein